MGQWDSYDSTNHDSSVGMRHVAGPVKLMFGRNGEWLWRGQPGMSVMGARVAGEQSVREVW